LLSRLSAMATPWAIATSGGQRRPEAGVRLLAVDGNIVSSRRPADLPAFCAAMVELFSTGTVKGRSAA
jgi:hypothetical protein